MQVKNIVAECGLTYNHIYLLDEEGQSFEYSFFSAESLLNTLFCEAQNNMVLEKITLIGATEYTSKVKEQLGQKLENFYGTKTSIPEIELIEKFN